MITIMMLVIMMIAVLIIIVPVPISTPAQAGAGLGSDALGGVCGTTPSKRGETRHLQLVHTCTGILSISPEVAFTSQARVTLIVLHFKV
eukprot:scaffold270_cov390-Prasinococcus_capsulatus_cf.AAC.7